MSPRLSPVHAPHPGLPVPSVLSVLSSLLVLSLLAACSPEAGKRGEKQSRAKKHKYVSDRTCVRCHGRQHARWKRGPHARAMRRLGSSRARFISRANGLGSSFSRRCRACHQTGWTAGGVGCQGCHGAGRDYYRHNRIARVKRYAWSVERGMAPRGPALKGCARCHERIRIRRHRGGRTTTQIVRAYMRFSHAGWRNKRRRHRYDAR